MRGCAGYGIRFFLSNIMHRHPDRINLSMSAVCNSLIFSSVRNETNNNLTTSMTSGFFNALSQGCTKLHSIPSIIALLLICTALTLGSILTFPIWDDGWFWLFLQERGADGIVVSLADRPVWAHLLSFFATSETSFWYVAFAAQALLWPALGVLSAKLWTFLFPDLRQYAFVVACLAIAPIVTTGQMLTGAQFALGPLLSIVMGYGALLLLLKFITTQQRFGELYLILSSLLFATSIILTEYGVPVALIAIMLTLAYPWLARDCAYGICVYIAILLVFVVMLATYAVYVSIADSGTRTNVHPGIIFNHDLSLLLRLASRWVEAAWKGVVGGFMTTLAHVQLRRIDLLPLLYGALVAALLVCGSYRPQQRSVSPHTVKNRLLLLLAALMVGLLPPLLMGRIPFEEGFRSRFGVPVLPITAMLTVYLGVRLVRPRFWFVPILLFGFAVGYVTLGQVRTELHERQIMARAGAALLPYASSTEGMSVAVIALPERSLGTRHAWELTARLTFEWPQSLRAHFWAYNSEQASSIFGERWNCNKSQEVDDEIRKIRRKGSVDQLLWIAPGPDNAITIEPYCIK